MDKEMIEALIKKLLNDIVPNISIYNDNAPRNAIYPYAVIETSKLSTLYYPRVDCALIINIWDKQANYSSVNKFADDIQNKFNVESFCDQNVSVAFFLDTRNKIVDEDKSLKRVQMEFEADFYFAEEA